jgi:hypothetical protein
VLVPTPTESTRSTSSGVDSLAFDQQIGKVCFVGQGGSLDWFCAVDKQSALTPSVAAVTYHDLISVWYDLQLWPEKNRLEECFLEKNWHCIFVVHGNAANKKNKNGSAPPPTLSSSYSSSQLFHIGRPSMAVCERNQYLLFRLLEHDSRRRRRLERSNNDKAMDRHDAGPY